MTKHHRALGWPRWSAVMTAAIFLVVASGCGGGAAPSSAAGSVSGSAAPASVAPSKPSAPAASSAAPSKPTAGAASSSSAASSAPTESLKVGVGSATTNYGAFWIAQTQGLFDKNGVKVNVVSYNTGANSATLVASGQVDLELFTIPLGLQVAAQGKPVSYVFTLASFNSAAGAIIGAKNVTSLSQLRTMGSNCRIATPGVGSVLHGYSVAIAKAYKLGCQQVGQASVPAEVAVTASGSVQAASVPYNTALAAVQAGKATMLLDPTKVPPEVSQVFGTLSYPAYAVFGQKAAVQAKKAEVIRFIKALRQANALALKTSPDELAKWSTQLPAAFGTATAASLAPAWQNTLLQMPKGDKAGFISESAWNDALQGFETWGMPNYDPKAPTISYSAAVDMSYFNQSS